MIVQDEYIISIVYNSTSSMFIIRNTEPTQQKKVNLNEVVVYYILNTIIIIIIIVVHLWAEYLELVLPNYYMITSQHFPDIEKDEVSIDKQDRFIEGIWCMHYIPSNRGTFYYPNGIY